MIRNQCDYKICQKCFVYFPVTNSTMTRTVVKRVLNIALSGSLPEHRQAFMHRSQKICAIMREATRRWLWMSGLIILVQMR